MTIGDVLNALPRRDRRAIERVLSKPGDVLKAARELKLILAQHAQLLERLGLLPDYAAYALPFYAWNVGGDINDFIASLQKKVQDQQAELARLERQIDGLRTLVETDPKQN
jgi:hypothetical protein